MKKAEIKEGGVYRASVSGVLVDVRVDEIVEHESRTYRNSFTNSPYTYKAKTRYCCTNLRTGRAIVVKSAAKFRREVKPTDAEITDAINSR